jgi:hypothetical protein
MKPGQTIAYTAGGKSVPATITAVTGAGPSGYKTLDLDVGGTTRQNVVHEADAIEGSAFWNLEGTEEELRAQEGAGNPWPEADGREEETHG